MPASFAPRGCLHAGGVCAAVAVDRVALPLSLADLRLRLLVLSFATLLLAPALWTVVAAQVVFGSVAGLIYYSSYTTAWTAARRRACTAACTSRRWAFGIFAGRRGAAALRLFRSSRRPPSGWSAWCWCWRRRALVAAGGRPIFGLANRGPRF